MFNVLSSKVNSISMFKMIKGKTKKIVDDILIIFLHQLLRILRTIQNTFLFAIFNIIYIIIYVVVCRYVHLKPKVYGQKKF